MSIKYNLPVPSGFDKTNNLTGAEILSKLGINNLADVTIDTKAVILALSPASGDVGFATDTKELLIYDGTNWNEVSIELSAVETVEDAGMWSQYPNEYSLNGGNDKKGYYAGAITDKTLANVKLTDTDDTNEGQVRFNSSTPQIYANSQWNDFVINFRLREDSNGAYEFEHRPIGFDWWYEVYSGNSNEVAGNGLPFIQNYIGSFGACPVRLSLSGRSS